MYNVMYKLFQSDYVYILRITCIICNILLPGIGNTRFVASVYACVNVVNHHMRNTRRDIRNMEYRVVLA